MDKIGLDKVLKEQLGSERDKIMGNLVQSWIDEGMKKGIERTAINILKRKRSKFYY